MIELQLLSLDQEAAASLARDASGFAEQHEISLGLHEATIAAVAADIARFLAAIDATPPWVNYLALDNSTRRVIGTCGFKGGPDADGAVEIAYFTLPEEEGRGVATAMAAALVKIASEGAPEVRIARAHTLPERNASCRVLEKTKFTYTGEVIDPEDGLVWRWERAIGEV